MIYDSTAEMCSAKFRVNFGMAHNYEGENGIAHLIEHLLFYDLSVIDNTGTRNLFTNFLDGISP